MKNKSAIQYSASDIAWHLPIRMETLPNQSKWNPVDTQGESDSANKEGNESGFVQVLKEGCKILCSWHLNSNQRRESTKLLWGGCRAQFCLILCDSRAGSLPGSLHGIFQARILEWVAISASRALPDPETEPMSLVSYIGSSPLSHLERLSHFRRVIPAYKLSTQRELLHFILFS